MIPLAVLTELGIALEGATALKGAAALEGVEGAKLLEGGANIANIPGGENLDQFTKALTQSSEVGINPAAAPPSIPDKLPDYEGLGDPNIKYERLFGDNTSDVLGRSGLTEQDIFFQATEEDSNVFQEFGGALKGAGRYVADKAIEAGKFWWESKKAGGVGEYLANQGELKFQADISAAYQNDPTVDFSKIASKNITAEQRSDVMKRFFLNKGTRFDLDLDRSIATGNPEGQFADTDPKELAFFQKIDADKRAAKIDTDLKVGRFNNQVTEIQTNLNLKEDKSKIERMLFEYKVDQDAKNQKAKKTLETLNYRDQQEAFIRTEYNTAVNSYVKMLEALQADFKPRGEGKEILNWMGKSTGRFEKEQKNTYENWLTARAHIAAEWVEVYRSISGFSAEQVRGIINSPALTPAQAGTGAQLTDEQTAVEIAEPEPDEGTPFKLPDKSAKNFGMSQYTPPNE